MKVKRLLLSLLMILSVFCVVACKGNGEKNPSTAEKQDPVLVVDYKKTSPKYAGEKLSTVELIFVGEHTIGTLSWENPDELLVLGAKSYKWKFVPTNTSKYNSKEGYLSVTANEPLADPQVSGVDYLRGDDNPIFIDAPLRTVQFSSAFTSLIDGTLSWSNPDYILKSDEETDGAGNVCTWLFTPVDSSWAKVSGTLIIHATEEQKLSSISAGPGTKTSGYVAFDSFETKGLTIELHYEAEKVVLVENPQDYAIAYQNGNSLRQGDTFVQLQYLGKTCQVNLETVGYKEIPIPQFAEEITYDGGPQLLQITGSLYNYYGFEELWGTNAGEYDLRVWLNYENDLKWEGTDDNEVVVKCYIQESPFKITPQKYTGIYDGEAHASTVSGEVNKVKTIYYSADVELTAENYATEGLETAPTFINVNTDAKPYIVYYYAVGADNYLDMSGMVEVQINPQSPNISLKYLYTLQHQDNKIINYPSDYVTITNNKGETLPKGTLEFVYYQRYDVNPSEETPNILTQPDVSGSATFGSAPKYHRDDVYYVVVKYAGDNANYAEAQAFTEIYIDVYDNGFHALDGVDEFAFKEIKSGDISTSGYGHTITGTNSEECKAYVEFSPNLVTELGIIEMTFESKFANVHGQVKSGKLIYENGMYYLVYSDESRAAIELINSNQGLEVVFANIGTIELGKWEIPTFINNTYSKKTVTNFTEGKNTSENTEISFYNDYGTIRFSAKVNTQYIYDQEYDESFGGYEQWAGVVVTDIVYNDGFWYTLNCYIIESDSLTSTGFSKHVYFSMKWPVTTKTPTIITLDGGDKIYSIYECLKGDYSA